MKQSGNGTEEQSGEENCESTTCRTRCLAGELEGLMLVLFPTTPVIFLLATPTISTLPNRISVYLSTYLLRALLLHLEGVGHDQWHHEVRIRTRSRPRFEKRPLVQVRDVSYF